MSIKIQQFYEIIRGNPNLTERQIADRAGIKKTPYSHAILIGLLYEGRIARYADPEMTRLTYRYFVQDTEVLL